MTVVNASDHNPNIRVVDIIGWVLWAIGLVVEAIADQQKLNLKKDPASKGRWCDVGVWKWSRHPNYFGEVRATVSQKIVYILLGVVYSILSTVSCLCRTLVPFSQLADSLPVHQVLD